MGSGNLENQTTLQKMWPRVTDVAGKAKKLGKDDPKRVIHSLKVALAITLVSLFYYFEPLYDDFGDAAMWAIMTVVVVFEFSVGATLGRGLLRGLATFLAGSLGFGAHRLAKFSGNIGEPIILGIFVFVFAAVVTFLRFFPKIKARYDYGLMIFILTFCLISVSGYREDELLLMAYRRLSTILIGGASAVAICVFICPVWAGDDLHKLIAANMEKLAAFLQEFGNEYFEASGQSKDNRASLQGYKSVLHSKSVEESLANFSKWEPRHGRIRYRHPWDQYLKIGALTRQCAYQIEALNGYLNSDAEIPEEIRGRIQDLCKEICSECGYTLKELALAIKTMSSPSSASTHFANAKIASKDLKSSLKTGPWGGGDINLLEIMSAVRVASLLIDVVGSIHKISEAVHQLASLARFRNVQDGEITPPPRPKLIRQKAIRVRWESEEGSDDHHIIHIHGSAAE